jgi:hypothetical protein
MTIDLFLLPTLNSHLLARIQLEMNCNVGSVHLEESNVKTKRSQTREMKCSHSLELRSSGGRKE